MHSYNNITLYNYFVFFNILSWFENVANMFLLCQRCVCAHMHVYMCENLCMFVFCVLGEFECVIMLNSNQSLCRMSLLSLKLFGHLSWPLDMPRVSVSVCVALALSLWQRGCWNINHRLFSLFHTSGSILMANETDLRNWHETGSWSVSSVSLKLKYPTVHM